MKRSLKLLDSSLSTFQSGQGFLRFLFLCSGAVLTALRALNLSGVYIGSFLSQRMKGDVCVSNFLKPLLLYIRELVLFQQWKHASLGTLLWK